MMLRLVAAAALCAVAFAEEAPKIDLEYVRTKISVLASDNLKKAIIVGVTEPYVLSYAQSSQTYAKRSIDGLKTNVKNFFKAYKAYIEDTLKLGTVPADADIDKCFKKFCGDKSFGCPAAGKKTTWPVDEVRKIKDVAECAALKVFITPGFSEPYLAAYINSASYNIRYARTSFVNNNKALMKGLEWHFEHLYKVPVPTEADITAWAKKVDALLEMEEPAAEATK